LFIYIPNFKEIALSNGKNFENGFWAISYEEFQRIKFILPIDLNFFQFLIIHKNPSEEEIVSNAYFQDNEFFLGPFITAEFTIINEDTINLRIKCICNPQNTEFEISGIPNDGIISFGEKKDEDTWIIDHTHCKNLLLKLDKNIERKRLNLSITGITKSYPHFNTTFNLIINLKEPLIPYKTRYKEIAIDTEEIIKQSKLRFDKYILSIKNLPYDCCVENGVIIDNKWIIEEKRNKKIKLQYFNLEAKELNVTFEYILINKDFPTTDNIYTKKIKYDLENLSIKTKDFTKCINCRNMSKCKLFKDFMDYIGNTTILRHIVPK
ncbi:MAG: hypothetical protein IJ638_04220, partial [Alphaproteobacteria bacterium]|nr:hypothetical protein [Alphaproteobacteria bacterium]